MGCSGNTLRAYADQIGKGDEGVIVPGAEYEQGAGTAPLDVSSSPPQGIAVLYTRPADFVVSLPSKCYTRGNVMLDPDER